MNIHNTNTRGRKLFLAAIVLSTNILFGCAAIPAQPQAVVRASTLPDLSGLAWVEDDLFIGIHDAKRSAEKYNWPRVSLVRLPKSELEGVTWQSLDLKFPGPEGRSSDLESASRIPGGKGFLFAESGQEGKDDRRIFFAVYSNGTLNIESQVTWPVPIENVEAVEVCRVGRQLVFLYAERADSLPATKLRWATLSLNPPEFGAFREVTYEGVDPGGKGARPVVALAVDTDGFIYSVSAYDSGNDDGPFRSVVWRIGKMIADEKGNPQIELGEGERLATLDGLKVESIAVRELNEGGKQVYVGTDDEHYGGIIRLLPGIH
ncbi:MAG: hypothetical protein EHM54_09990 [Nitrospiraceae bacterium]|nr:MAG: hypothetical protein EHM54_09990 [Nitrospiraceae bacterium]